MKLCGSFRSSNIPRPPNSIFIGFTDLVLTDNEINLLMAKQSGSHSVSFSIDIDDFSGFGKGIGGAQIDIGLHSIEAGFILLLLPVPVDSIVCAQKIIEAQGFNCSRTAYSDCFAVNLLIQPFGSFSTGYRDLAGVCLRIALADAMYPDPAADLPPLILDDPFTSLDDDKMAGAMRLLEEAAQCYQILYFTCSRSRYGPSFSDQ